MEKSSLRKFLAPEFIFGVDSRKSAYQYALNFGAEKVFIVTDKGVVQAGWVKELTESLSINGMDYFIFSELTENPKDFEIMNGARLYDENSCDVIIAIGGGSVIDCAKGIGIVAVHGEHILKFEGVDKLALPLPPLICLPTTGGTSADVSQFAIVNDTINRTKIAIISKAAVPDVALIDPEMLLSLGTYYRGATGVDALVHSIEAFVSNASSSFTDLHALEGIKLITENLIPSLKDPENLDLSSRIMEGSLQAGLAFSNASLGAVHAMSHSLGGYKDLPHGECNALLLNHVIQFNFDSTPERFYKIAEVAGLDLKGMNTKEKKDAIFEYFRNFVIQAGITGTLSDRGVGSSDIGNLSKNVMKDPCIVTNPKKPVLRDIEVLYEESL